jgi:transcription initiation factor TFIIF subunit beta
VNKDQPPTADIPTASRLLHGQASISKQSTTMADPLIKLDPETQGASPGPFSEDDIYEDAGDLEFNLDPNFQKLYLARVPKFLWEAWSKLDDDAEIHIGTIRQMRVPGPDGSLRV